MPIKTRNTTGEQNIKKWKLLSTWEYWGKKELTSQCTKRVSIFQKRNQKDREDSGTYIGHFCANKTSMQPRKLSIALTINRYKGKCNNMINYTFTAIFSYGDFLILMGFVCLMTLNYISLSITCPVSPVTHAKFLYLKHILERKIP